jgi:hypothetical protein
MEHASETLQPRTSHALSKTVNDLVGVMSKLKAVIEAENALLHRGMPASVLETMAAKGALTREYAQLGVAITSDAGSASDVLSDPSLHDMLIEAGASLCALTEENRALLAGALSATRRRVDAVMKAIRTDGVRSDDGTASDARET